MATETIDRDASALGMEKLACALPSTDLDISALYEKHKLLKENTIRVLELQPSTETTEPIVTTMRVISLHNQEAFQTLSYAWGSGNQLRHICCDALRVPVSENLLQALVRIRQKIPSTDDERNAAQPFLRTLWIDAICINQDDPDEKPAQVRLMASVYPEGQCLIIWLGEATDEQSQCLQKALQENVLKRNSAPRQDVSWQNRLLVIRQLLARLRFKRQPRKAPRQNVLEPNPLLAYKNCLHDRGSSVGGLSKSC